MPPAQAAVEGRLGVVAGVAGEDLGREGPGRVPPDREVAGVAQQHHPLQRVVGDPSVEHGLGQVQVRHQARHGEPRVGVRAVAQVLLLARVPPVVDPRHQRPEPHHQPDRGQRDPLRSHQGRQQGEPADLVPGGGGPGGQHPAGRESRHPDRVAEPCRDVDAGADVPGQVGHGQVGQRAVQHVGEALVGLAGHQHPIALARQRRAHRHELAGGVGEAVPGHEGSPGRPLGLEQLGPGGLPHPVVVGRRQFGEPRPRLGDARCRTRRGDGGSSHPDSTAEAAGGRRHGGHGDSDPAPIGGGRSRSLAGVAAAPPSHFAPASSPKSPSGTKVGGFAVPAARGS